jgi:hypothetical protein
MCTPPQNNPPVANAGADQSVAASAAVVLNGSASSDPDGDALTYSWTVVSGTVTLINPTSAVATFTAPSSAATLVFQLTVSDGQATSSDYITVTVAGGGGGGGGGTTPTLFVACVGGNNVLAWQMATPTAINGNIAPDANLSGGLTALAAPTDVLIDAAGNLLVSNTGATLTSYANGMTMTSINGNVAPNRNVSGAATLLAFPDSLALSASTDVLFVAERGVNQIYAYNSGSTATLNGNIPPSRTITGASLGVPHGICLDGSDNLYVGNNGANNIAVFAGASALNGAVPASRVLTAPAVFANIEDVRVDGSDNLFVVCGAPVNTVNVITSASTRNGVVAPSVTLTVAGAVNITSIDVDSAGRGYICDRGANSVYSYDNIATRNGALAPDRTLAGASTQLIAPWRLHVEE